MSDKTAKASAWVYSGVWSVLADWFMVPKEPPLLPSFSPGEYHAFRPSEGFLRYLKLWFWLALLAVDVVIIGLWLASFLVNVWLGVALAVPAWAIAVVPDIVAYVAIHLRYDTTWYVMTDRSLRIRRGIWVITEMTITFENVQNVRVQQGPVQRYYRISDLIVDTAGAGAGHDHHGRGPSISNEARIEGIDNAAEIRDLVLLRVKQSRTAGLGDEGEERRGNALGTAAHLRLLREIREAIRATTSALDGG